MSFDLLVRGGRLIDPHSNTDAPLDVAIAGGRVAAIDRDIPPDRARQVVDAKGGIVTPGLIDIHTHVYWGGTSLGVDADAIAPRSGTTTFVDAGSAGAGNFLGFRRHVIERSRARILAYMNISFAGIFGFDKDLTHLLWPLAVSCGQDRAQVRRSRAVGAVEIGSTAGRNPVTHTISMASTAWGAR